MSEKDSKAQQNNQNESLEQDKSSKVENFTIDVKNETKKDDAKQDSSIESEASEKSEKIPDSKQADVDTASKSDEQKAVELETYTKLDINPDTESKKSTETHDEEKPEVNKNRFMVNQTILITLGIFLGLIGGYFGLIFFAFSQSTPEERPVSSSSRTSSYSSVSSNNRSSVSSFSRSSSSINPQSNYSTNVDGVNFLYNSNTQLLSFYGRFASPNGCINFGYTDLDLDLQNDKITVVIYYTNTAKTADSVCTQVYKETPYQDSQKVILNQNQLQKFNRLFEIKEVEIK